jgi:signal transduction histidine kinase
VFLLAYTVIEITSNGSAGEALPLHLAGAALMTLPLAFRRIRPWIPGLAFLPAMLADSVWVVPVNSFGEFVAAMLVTYSLAVHATPRDALLGGGAFTVAITVFLIRDPMTPNLAQAMSTVLVLLAWVGIGLFVRRRSDEVDLRTRQAAAEERTRIARELHDLVGHAVSLMTVQAGVGRVALDSGDPGRADQALEAVETAGRQALDDLRRVLGILQAPGGDVDAFAPQPGVDAVEDLVQQHRCAGLPVAFHLEGEPRPLPAGVSLTVFRIVQEALTNIRKHAGSPPTDVTLRYGPDQVALEVRDHGTGPRGRARTGHGLAGMAQRVALYGGRLQAGQDPGGGFVVAAELPTVEVMR